MADEETKTYAKDTNLSDLQGGDVFINGDSEDESKNESANDQESLDTLSFEKPIPRKSSFMNKDGTRRTHNRKKTVSFSSMPTERKIATGKNSRDIVIELIIYR